ncbi:unnamed protein product [Parajaminaea phylloscopi]
MNVFDHGPAHTNRDLVGYAAEPPNVQWPNGARVAVSFVLNYEEGGENTLLNPGDTSAESFLTENGVTPTVLPPLEGRELSRESTYAYGARVGFWRILDLFKDHSLRFTSWAVGRAVELNPDVAPAMQRAGCEVASHAYRWINYAGVDEETERAHAGRAIDTLTRASADGKTPPLGWYTGRCSLNTRKVVYEAYKQRGLHTHYYDSDAYDDDLPYYVAPPTSQPDDVPILVVPYTLDVNDMKFAVSPGFSNPSDFSAYLQSALQTHLDDAEREARPRSSVLTIGLHCRIIGRPGRFQALKSFVETCAKMQEQGRVWIATRGEIAQYWRQRYPPKDVQAPNKGVSR